MTVLLRKAAQNLHEQATVAGMANDSAHQLSSQDFKRLADFIHEYSGIKMPIVKKTMVESRLRGRLRALNLPSLRDYCRYVFDEGGLYHESVHLIDAVTTNKTEFFREPEHFRFLVDQALPSLLAAEPAYHHARLKVWSAACSIGAEPYTLAMVLAEAGVKPHSFRIYSTDICTEVLQTAKTAIYPEIMIEPIPPLFRRQYLLKAKAAPRDTFRIIPDLRGSVQFGRLNFMESPYDLERDMHVIFCRNVLIYFDKATQNKVLEQLCQHLRPGGFLFLGHSESLAGFSLPLTQVAATVFQRQ